MTTTTKLRTTGRSTSLSSGSSITTSTLKIITTSITTSTIITTTLMSPVTYSLASTTLTTVNTTTTTTATKSTNTTAYSPNITTNSFSKNSTNTPGISSSTILTSFNSNENNLLKTPIKNLVLFDSINSRSGGEQKNTADNYYLGKNFSYLNDNSSLSSNTYFYANSEESVSLNTTNSIELNFFKTDDTLTLETTHFFTPKPAYKFTNISKSNEYFLVTSKNYTSVKPTFTQANHNLSKIFQLTIKNLNNFLKKTDSERVRKLLSNNNAKIIPVFHLNNSADSLTSQVSHKFPSKNMEKQQSSMNPVTFDRIEASIISTQNKSIKSTADSTNGSFFNNNTNMSANYDSTLSTDFLEKKKKTMMILSIQNFCFSLQY